MPWEKNFNKDEVLDKVMQAFWMRGYEATSMQDLVECTGVNRASLYATYGDKRALFLASLQRYDHGRQSMLKGLAARHEPRDAIWNVFMAFASAASSPGGNRGCMLTNTALELAAHDDEVRRIVADAQTDIETFFFRTVEAGQANGQFAARLDASEAARGLLASMLGFVVLVRSRPEPALLASIVEEALRRLE